MVSGACEGHTDVRVVDVRLPRRRVVPSAVLGGVIVAGLALAAIVHRNIALGGAVVILAVAVWRYLTLRCRVEGGVSP